MKRRPNSSGYICFLGKNRAKPYAAYTSYLYVNGKRKRMLIGTFATYAEADDALHEWKKSKSTKTNYTTEMVYKAWSEKTYKDIVKSTVDCYKSAWKKIEHLSDVKFRDLCKGDFQDIIDEMAKNKSSYSSMNNVRIVAKGMGDYAKDYRIVSENCAENLNVPAPPENEKELFSEKQIALIEKLAAEGDRTAKIITILMYSGWRIGELLELKPEDYDSERNCFVGGNKTESGKQRIVPVHPAIQGYVDEFLAEKGPRFISRQQFNGKGEKKHVELVPITPNYFRRYWFTPFIEEHGIYREDGEPFTPHVTRHVFCSWCEKFQVDDFLTKKLAGHKIPKSDVTKSVYTHVDYEMLLCAMLRIKANKNQQQ